LAGTTSVVDPCVGTGAALNQLTDGAEAQKYGVELDSNRVAAAATSGITTFQRDLFNTIAKVESFSFLSRGTEQVEIEVLPRIILARFEAN
jgi:hypothetical protein